MHYNSPLIWIDLEMTGLNYNKDTILEIATVITDNKLNITAVGPNIIINQPDSILNDMDDWCKVTHKKNNLTEKVKSSKTSLKEAELQTMEFIQKWCKHGESPLCGNSVGVDRRFLEARMPEVDNFLNYRTIDVSTIKELALRWRPDIPKFNKPETHRALDDIKESINELRYYTQSFINI